MFGTRRLENPYDPDDDGRDLEITPEEEAASDDEGRAEAETLLGQMGAKERNQNDRNFRRWLLRLAKKALAEGARRRRVARKQGKARIAAERQAAAERNAQHEASRKWRANFQRWNDGFDARWDALMEQARRDDAAWEAKGAEREAAERAAQADATNRRASVPATPPRTVTPSSFAAGPAIGTAISAPPSPGPQPLSATANVPPGSRVHPPSASPPPTAASASMGQPHREAPTLVKLDPPTTLTAYAAPSAAPRAASPPARPILATRAPSARSRSTPSPWNEARPPTTARPAPSSPAPSQPLPPPPPPAAPSPPEPPAFTGADLAAYRASLGLSQGALAERLGTTQGTVSKAEGNPAAVLGPTLRRAMWDTQRGAGGASR